MSTRTIQILCPQTGLVKTVTVYREQMVGSVLGELGWEGTLYVGDHALDSESTFVGRPHESLVGDDMTDVEPYRFGPSG